MEEGGFLRETVDDEERSSRSSPFTWRSNSTANVDVVPNFAKRVLPDEGPRNYNGCTKCNSLSFSQEFSDAFGVLLCAPCRRKEKLISKSTAKQQYLLSDGDLSKLGSLRRNNPHRKDWQPMKLYMESQVVDLAISKYGGIHQIEAHRKAVVNKKLQNRLQQREMEKRKDDATRDKLLCIRKNIEEGKPTALAELENAEVEDI